MTTLVGQSLGQYQIVGFLGEGGIAHVYRARRSNEKSDVAIKVIKPGIINLEDFVKRFKREAMVGSCLSHPHILNVISYGQQGATVYIVMPLLTGGNLADLAQRKKLRLEEISSVIDQVASALDYMHARGIVHRDVKLDNILLDDDGRPVLSDLGMVKALTEASKQMYQRVVDTRHSTRKGMVLGTPGYMSPEQCKSQTVDARSDIYSLGVVLFELLAGELPFQGESSIEAMYMHIAKEPPAVSSIKPELSTDLDDIVRRALAKNPCERFASAGDLATTFRTAVFRQSESPTRKNSASRSSPVPNIHSFHAQEQARWQPASSSRLFLLLFCAVIGVIGVTAVMVTVLLSIPD